MSNVITFENFSNKAEIKHAISTKAFGSMKTSELKIDRNNLSKFCKEVGMNGPIVCMDQVHSGTVAVVKNSDETLIPNTDGMITNQKNLPLSVITADCLPILLYDPRQHAVGVAHAGYKGLLRDIIHATIAAMKKEFGTQPSDLLIGIGPGIEEPCYEVGEEVIDMFRAKGFDEASKVWSTQKEKTYLSIRKIALQLLLQEGIRKENIEVSTLCTKCDDKLYSYRGGDKTGRFASVISLI
jgi:YfiH family protein